MCLDPDSSTCAGSPVSGPEPRLPAWTSHVHRWVPRILIPILWKPSSLMTTPCHQLASSCLVTDGHGAFRPSYKTWVGLLSVSAFWLGVRHPPSVPEARGCGRELATSWSPSGAWGTWKRARPASHFPNKGWRWLRVSHPVPHTQHHRKDKTATTSLCPGCEHLTRERGRKKHLCVRVCAQCASAPPPPRPVTWSPCPGAEVPPVDSMSRGPHALSGIVLVLCSSSARPRTPPGTPQVP